MVSRSGCGLPSAGACPAVSDWPAWNLSPSLPLACIPADADRSTLRGALSVEEKEREEMRRRSPPIHSWHPASHCLLTLRDRAGLTDEVQSASVYGNGQDPVGHSPDGNLPVA